MSPQREELADGRVILLPGDCATLLATLEPDSIDSVCTDPPYHLTSIVQRFGKEGSAPAQFGKDGAFARASRGFMGKQWDGGDIAFRPELWTEVLRVMKPGAHLLAFGGTRTYHRLACAIEDAGFEIRDAIMWHYGSGFPKSLDVSKAIDRAAGAEREVVGVREYAGGHIQRSTKLAPPIGTFVRTQDDRLETAPATATAREWDGWHTALKPATEIIVLARKPLAEKTVAANVLAYGTGAINVGACRVAIDETEREIIDNRSGAGSSTEGWGHIGIRSEGQKYKSHTGGRWPSNVIHDASPEVLAAFAAFGESKSPDKPVKQGGHHRHDVGLTVTPDYVPGDSRFGVGYGDSGSPSRYFMKCEPDAVCEVCGSDPSRVNEFGGWCEGVLDLEHPSGLCLRYGEQARVDGPLGSLPIERASRFWYSSKADSDSRLGSKHPTIKPLSLIQYLVRLITPKGGTCLDLFAGTGTTGEACIREGMRAILIEREVEYQQDIRRRMALALAGPDERRHSTIKAKGKVETAGPLFAEFDL